jgi:uncharacterized protein
MPMDLRISGIEWDQGNRDKCQQHGLTIPEIEHALLHAQNLIVRDIRNSIVEDRYIAIGKSRAGRFAFVVFTLRLAGDGLKVRPISARYMHKKEVAKYEKEIARLQNR